MCMSGGMTNEFVLFNSSSCGRYLPLIYIEYEISENIRFVNKSY